MGKEKVLLTHVKTEIEICVEDAISYFKRIRTSARVKKLFSIRLILHYLCTRLGNQRLRSWAFDQKYSEEWSNHLGETHSSESPTVKFVEKYARKGRILDLGCGTGGFVSRLSHSYFESYLGVDVSPTAISIAKRRKSRKADFEVGDLRSYECKEEYDLILFQESLYYVPFSRYQLLLRYARSLRPGGLLIVTVAHPDQFRGMIRMIRRNFQIIEDKLAPSRSGRLLLAFR
jgi:SAM-dependent methyltransferase